MCKSTKKIAIVGRIKDTTNYERALNALSIPCKTTLSLSEIRACDGLLLPGGGDITPAFFGQKNAGSKNIDTELDIIQLQALEQALYYEKPILGICKGMQIINVFFGGTIVQHMKDHKIHEYRNGDQKHETTIVPETFLHTIYGDSLTVNSAHHQCLDKLGNNLLLAQYAAPSPTPEAVCHKQLPVYGVQWHPERLGSVGDKLLAFFYALLG